MTVLKTVPVVGSGSEDDPRRPDLAADVSFTVVADDGDTMTVEVEDGAATDAEQANESTVRQRADQALADLRQIRDTSGTLTGAQLSQAVRVMARVLIALVRLVLRKLDDTE